MADWDAEDFEPTNFDEKNKSDKWEGEDEDDGDIKENWDDDETEGGKKKDEETSETTKSALATKKKKRPLKEVLKEKEEKRLEEIKLKAEMKKQMEEVEPISAEEELAEKLRQQKLQEDSDLLLAMETFGKSNTEEVSETNTLDSMNPKTVEEFTEYSKMLVNKLSTFESSILYIQFLEDTLRDICASLDPDDIKRLSSTLNLLHSEKVKAQKGKLKGKGKTKKASQLAGGIKGGKKDDMEYSLGDFGSEFDDFI